VDIPYLICCIVVKYTPYGKMLERFSIEWDRWIYDVGTVGTFVMIVIWMPFGEE